MLCLITGLFSVEGGVLERQDVPQVSGLLDGYHPCSPQHALYIVFKIKIITGNSDTNMNVRSMLVIRIQFFWCQCEFVIQVQAPAPQYYYFYYCYRLGLTSELKNPLQRHT